MFFIYLFEEIFVPFQMFKREFVYILLHHCYAISLKFVIEKKGL